MLELPKDLVSMEAAPTTPRLAERYGRMLEATADFARLEYPEVEVSAVAERAGVSASTAYRYFPSAAHLLLALHRRQLIELRERVAKRSRSYASREVRTRHLTGAAVELLQMRLSQPAVNSCLDELVVPADHELARLIGEVDELSWSVLGRLGGGAARGKSIVLMVSGLVAAIRTGRLLPVEAEQQLKDACALLEPTTTARLA
ncbi:helix-turn-helix domain-containing protein [Sinomonas sp. JGH33]|uniref:Helix-turn-helix domain-containing protein n=1 Tax=Sinomonas terricola TaxID=3110330 RepID=A0ABU5T7Q7_9MICC|nr:helix-turn-helix domain-containing protein [Sinomonas sp. JGH33]MEA5455715.1 helix-turn-helix domain-containing protein [Sinomonas sp. JGH33]